MTRSILPGLMAAALLACPMASTAAQQANEESVAPAAAETPTTYSGRLERELKRIGNFTLNARVKIQNGVVGRSSSNDIDAQTTPAQQCCVGNLNKLAESLKQIVSVVAELDACYARGGEGGSTAMTALFIDDVRGYGRSLQAFANAPSTGDAMSALAAMTRGYNRMKSSSSDLAHCEP